MTELFINNVSVDLSEDIQHSLNYAIADIREPDKRDTSYSKTITLVGSKDTNQLFSHLFEVSVTVNSSGTTNFSPSFNPNLKASAIMYADNIAVFSGFVQLKNIIVLDKYEVEYEVVLYGKLGDIFFNLGENELTELDLSEYNHVYSQTNIVNSWNVNNTGVGYHYPMIDFGANDTINWKVKDFKPSVWLKQYIDKIFTYAGYTYTCDFFNTQFFKRLHMPFVGEGFRVSEDSVLQRLFKARQTTDVTNNAYGGYVTRQFNSEDSDVGNDYNTSTYKWTCPANGTYVLSADITTALRFVPNSPAYFASVKPASFGSPLGRANNSINGQIELVKEDAVGGAIHVIGTANIFPNGSISTFRPNSDLITGDTTYPQFTNRVTTGSLGYYLGVGDTVYVRTQLTRYNGQVLFNAFTDASNAAVSGNIYYVSKAGSIFENSFVNNGYSEGEVIEMNSTIPTKVKMRDILASTLKKYNLYVEQDQTSQNNLIITPRNDFYSSETEDWSNKLDYNSPFNIEPMGGLDAKRYELTWDYDEDYWNKYYKDKYNKTYGNRTIDVANDFVSNTVETKVIWSATVPVNNDVSDRIVPTILNTDGTQKTKSSKVRLLYYGGTRYCDAWKLGTTTYYQYPYSGHLDDPLNSTVDLNFGVVSELMYTNPYIIYTNNNVYNKYHKQFIDEITDKDSKIVTAFFYLTPSDILKLDFRKNYYFDNNYYRLNKVFDYNPSGDGLTKCEFIKILNTTTFVSSGTVYTGGSEPIEQNEEGYPSFKTSQPDGGANRNYVRGLDNVVSASARNIMVIGDYNVVGDSTDGAFVVNSSGNVIGGGLQNVTLINSSGQNVTESNIAFINNNLITNPVYDYSFVGASTGADTNSTILYTYYLPANSVIQTGDTIFIEACFTATNNANTKQCRIVFSTDEIADFTATSGDIINFKSRVTNLGAGSYSFVTTTETHTGVVLVENNAYFADFADKIPITFTGQNGTASAGDTTLYDVLIYILRKK